MKNKRLIKVCGLNNSANIHKVEQAGADMIGFIFYPQSPRYINHIPDYLPEKAKRVGVFVNEDIEHVAQVANHFSLDYIQLHGNEPIAYCLKLKETGRNIIKSISINHEKDIEKSYIYEEICDLLLFDTAHKGYGGSGKRFDWSILNHYKGKTAFLLSGGINLECIEELRSFHHPMLYGYDINSLFEITPGIKDIKKVTEFINQINNII